MRACVRVGVCVCVHFSICKTSQKVLEKLQRNLLGPMATLRIPSSLSLSVLTAIFQLDLV